MHHLHFWRTQIEFPAATRSLQLQFQRVRLLLVSLAIRHTHGAQTHMWENTHTHKIDKHIILIEFYILYFDY